MAGLKEKEIKLIFKRGKSKSTKSLTIYWLKARVEGRTAFSISKKIGKAHTRNRIRRRLKAAFDTMPERKIHFVVIIRADLSKVKFEEILNEVEKLWELMLKVN